MLVFSILLFKFQLFEIVEIIFVSKRNINKFGTLFDKIYIRIFPAKKN